MGSRCGLCKHYYTFSGYDRCKCKKDSRHDYLHEEIDCPYYEDDIWD